MIAVRPFTADDAQRVCEVFYRSVHEVASAAYTREQRDAWVPAVPDPARWIADLLAYDTRVALNDAGEIIAWIAMTPAGYIDMIFRLPEAAGLGAATKLYEAVERAAIERGIALLTAHASLLAQPFFLKHGWTLDVHERYVKNGIELPRAQMSKRLRLG